MVVKLGGLQLVVTWNEVESCDVPEHVTLTMTDWLVCQFVSTLMSPLDSAVIKVPPRYAFPFVSLTSQVNGHALTYEFTVVNAERPNTKVALAAAELGTSCWYVDGETVDKVGCAHAVDTMKAAESTVYPPVLVTLKKTLALPSWFLSTITQPPEIDTKEPA